MPNQGVDFCIDCDHWISTGYKVNGDRSESSDVILIINGNLSPFLSPLCAEKLM